MLSWLLAARRRRGLVLTMALTARGLGLRSCGAPGRGVGITAGIDPVHRAADRTRGAAGGLDRGVGGVAHGPADTTADFAGLACGRRGIQPTACHGACAGI